jgi:hypothetical protein
MTKTQANPIRRGAFAGVASLLLALTVAPSCGDDSGDPDENAGETCAVADECYRGIDASMLQGEVVCIDKVEGGYCSHKCVADADCCAVSGECETGHPQVCAPFESTGEMYCFLSCEAQEVGELDADAYCNNFAHLDFGCRSSGGGSANRKICSP